ncbi:hypothetical protein EYF80_065243 [Liparis tanakae]|uniref:Uncharacterized protein n=1 Tax=Liparis tanakae TaxID=230148 RepID=A0A4Z2E797_9TELE|nr:hypothetical protein EYF80_065243 [Liparis tanakae]
MFENEVNDAARVLRVSGRDGSALPIGREEAEGGVAWFFKQTLQEDWLLPPLRTAVLDQTKGARGTSRDCYLKPKVRTKSSF